MESNNRSSQLDLVAEISQDIFFRYDSNSKTMYIPSAISKKLNLKEVYHPMPEAFIKEHVFEEDKKMLLDFFTTDEPEITSFRLKTNGQKSNWYKGVLKKVPDSNLYTGYFRDINQEVKFKLEEERLKTLSVIQNWMLRVPVDAKNESFKFLDYLATFFSADQAFVAMYDPDLKIKFSSGENEFCGPIFSENEMLYFLDKKYLKHSSKVATIHDLEDFSEVQSLIDLPLFGKDGSTIGILGIVNAKRDNISEKILNVISSSLSLTMQNLLYNQELEIHSMYDMLTGVKNRNAYETYLKKLNPSLLKSMGFIVVDINGLKACNDTAGHIAGDLLIRTVAQHLANVFDNHNVYRFGGDEFIVVCENISEEMLKRKIDLFYLEASDTSVSLGYAFSVNEICIKEMQIEADKKMYLDKKAFYKNKTEINSRKN